MDTISRCTLMFAVAALLAACSPGDQPAAETAATAPAPAAIAPAAPAAADAPVDGLDIVDAWIRSAPPGAPALAGYATLRNHGAAPVIVRTCDSPGFAATELHETLHEDGIARMRPVAELVVPAQGQAVLEPGGAHLMLMQPAGVPAEGGTVDVCLLVDGAERQVPFELRAAATPAQDQHHQHHN